jgi:hypothetical protein
MYQFSPLMENNVKFNVDSLCQMFIKFHTDNGQRYLATE